MFSVSLLKAKPRTGRSETISTCGCVPPETTAEQNDRDSGVTPAAACEVAAALPASATTTAPAQPRLDTTVELSQSTVTQTSPAPIAMLLGVPPTPIARTTRPRPWAALASIR